ncbi:MAG: glycosyltransferase [bacterium]|nr:glycosyltransferase [bacterium]
MLTIIIPTFNEEGNIRELINRIDSALKSYSINYKILFIDDRSTDQTTNRIRSLMDNYPIQFLEKPVQIPKGKAFSLMYGFRFVKTPYIAMIDADLQYPPEALPQMLSMLTSQSADIVVADRVNKQTSRLRNLISNSFNYIFVKKLHNINVDSQSGLKVFKSKVLSKMNLSPTPWTFDLEFLLNAKIANYKIESYPITLSKRHSGETKINIIKTSYEIGKNAIALKLRHPKVISLSDEEITGNGVGFFHQGKKFIPHTKLHHSQSALFSVTAIQKIILIAIFLTIAIGLITSLKTTLIVVIAILTIFYFSDLLFNFYLIYSGLSKNPEIKIGKKEVESNNERDWPIYSVFCPLYKEWEVLPQFIHAMSKMDYPKDKLQVMLLLEEDDKQTIEKARAFNLPSYFDIVVVPHSKPKTKPKACNYGLNKAQGKFVVIYDAEDVPDILQLKRAVIAFDNLPSSVKCIQAKLNYYNPKQNLLTRMFTAEYSLWFDLILPGLQSFNTLIPLGGTSNHFRLEDLHELNGWDAFNVTEDCDLGIRLAKLGYTTAILQSVTLEEANSDTKNWIWQRSRWIKGYMQSYLVHMRKPQQFFKSKKKMHFLALQINVGAKVLSLFINPLMWLITIIYFAARTTLGPVIESLFPSSIFYMAIISLLFGNFMYLYAYMLGCAKHGHYNIIKYAFLIPVYWLMMSVAAWVALYQLIVAPHSWAKTKHGLHLKQKIEPALPPTASLNLQQV